MATEVRFSRTSYNAVHNRRRDRRPCSNASGYYGDRNVDATKSVRPSLRHSLFFTDNLKSICHRCIMLNLAATRLLPTLAEVHCVAQRHIFQTLCQEAKRNLNNASFLHVFMISYPRASSVLIARSLVAIISSSVLPAIGCDNIAFFIVYSSTWQVFFTLR